MASLFPNQAAGLLGCIKLTKSDAPYEPGSLYNNYTPTGEFRDFVEHPYNRFPCTPPKYRPYIRVFKKYHKTQMKYTSENPKPGDIQKREKNKIATIKKLERYSKKLNLQ